MVEGVTRLVIRRNHLPEPVRKAVDEWLKLKNDSVGRLDPELEFEYHDVPLLPTVNPVVEAGKKHGFFTREHHEAYQKTFVELLQRKPFVTVRSPGEIHLVAGIEFTGKVRQPRRLTLREMMEK